MRPLNDEAHPEIEPGRTYTAPAGTGAGWFHDRLKQALTQGWVGPILVTLHLGDGGSIRGVLEKVSHLPDGTGTVYLEPLSEREDLIPIRCSELVAFRVAADLPIDHSDELGRG